MLRDMPHSYLPHTANGTAHVRYFEGGERRPVAILVHGYLGGNLNWEQKLWPISWLDGLGFDVALFTLPFHGLRAPVSGTPLFPSSDPLFNVEGFRQCVTDLRDLIGWFHQRGHPHVGLLGMSLGGYVCSLTATIESSLSFLVPVVPLACLVDFAREQGRMPRGSRQALAYQATLERTYRLVSPFSRASRIDSQRVLVVAGKADRITPPSHARRLAHHFSAPLESFSGGHLLQFGRSQSLKRVGIFLREVTA